jgi:hypothetical protein
VTRNIKLEIILGLEHFLWIRSFSTTGAWKSAFLLVKGPIPNFLGARSANQIFFLFKKAIMLRLFSFRNHFKNIQTQNGENSRETEAKNNMAYFRKIFLFLAAKTEILIQDTLGTQDLYFFKFLLRKLWNFVGRGKVSKNKQILHG